MSDRSMIPMFCLECHEPMGALDAPREWRSLGDWLEERGIVPLCTKCYQQTKWKAILEGRNQ